MTKTIKTVIVKNGPDVTKNIRLMMLACGGAMLMSCAEPSKFDEFKGNLPLVLREAFISPETQVIVLMHEMSDLLTKKELRAITLHEEGHFMLGHANGALSGITVNEEFEFAADAYVFDKMGEIKSLISALKKMKRFVLDVYMPEFFASLGMNEVSDSAKKETEAQLDKVMERRFERLRAISKTKTSSRKKTLVYVGVGIVAGILLVGAALTKR